MAAGSASGLDSATGCAMTSLLARGYGCATGEYRTGGYSIGILRPSFGNTGRPLHAGRRIATADGRPKDSAGRLFATGTTCMGIDPREQ